MKVEVEKRFFTVATSRALCLHIPGTSLHTYVPKSLVYPLHDDNDPNSMRSLLNYVYVPEGMRFNVYVGHSRKPLFKDVEIGDILGGLYGYDIPEDILSGKIHHTPKRIEPVDRGVEDEFKR